MFKLLLFSGLFVFSLCIPTKDLSSQSDVSEFYSDLESSQFLLTDQNSRPSGPKSSEMRVRRAASFLIPVEGSGMLEDSTTTTKSPTTTTTAAATGINASSSGEISSKISLFTTCGLTLLSVLVMRSW